MVSSAFESLFHKGLLWIADPQQDFSRASSSFIGTARGSSYSHPKTAPFGISEIDSALPDAGLRGAAIHEFFSDSPDFNLCAIPALIAGNVFKSSPGYLVWVGRRAWPTPFFLHHLQLTLRLPSDFLSFCLFVDPPTSKLSLWAIDAALRTRGVGVVIADCQKLSFVVSRRLTLAAEQGHTLGILHRPPNQHKVATSAVTRWRITPAPSPSAYPRWEIALLKCKGGQPLTRSWIVELKHEAALSLHIPADVVHRSVSQAQSRAA